ncbi:arogenate dehydratase/prephenate dehydratase 6, chloroplastic-like [Neltuma alba]|uniref:arogenate dehydratase/prephenate dehydratase 6, chloroplastic-like n=1 Tax=Neltuma alba TaxID=207710 RepID=UPI0010A4B6AE|nr:arogenate dehydratase/prephenate dehydratase 6, chloroplastic-like [Prosopis alba]XP_028788623.1 arogenate dehydratase/prephenate dehydratase 6, chloroplastic-like [Prosopis alba]
MRSLSPAPSHSLQFPIPTRPLPSPVVVKCSYGFESPGFSHGVSSNRTDWQSSCAILASKVVSQQHSSPDSNNGAPTVNGHTSALTDLSLVPIDNIPGSDNNRPLPPKPLTISDLSPAPMHGSQLRVAYQGVPGAYSEAAAAKAYANCEAIPCDQFEVAFQAVELWIADRAVLPVENSLGGSIHRNYDLLLRHRLHIVGEVQLPVHHCLLALPGVRKEYLTRVISHPQALAQCEHTLTKLGLNVAREAVDDTAGAAEFIATNNLRDTAAIASARAAELYGMQVLADGIQDDPGNVTRFVMLAREPIIPRTDRPFKTSIVFAHDKGTSVLFKVLSAFAFRNISLTKIESRPHRNRPIRLVDDANVGTAKHFEYLFYVDFEASMAEVRAQNALAEVQEFTSFLRVLGSYPMDMTPLSSSCGRQDLQSL